MANVNFFSPDGGITRYPLEDTEGRIMYEDDIEGINLFNVTLSELKARNTIGTWSGNTYTHNGISYTINDDNTVSLSGTASGESTLNYYHRVNYPLKLNTGRYVLSGGYSDNCYIILGKTYNNAWLEVGKSTADNDVIFDTLNTDNFGITIIISSGQILSNAVVKPMITDAKYAGIPYRPYNQQSIQHQINDITGVTGVRNWLRVTAETQTNNGITYTVNKDSNGNVISVVLNGTATAFSQLYLNSDLHLEQGKEYIVSDGISRTAQTVYSLRIGDASDSYAAGTAYGVGNQDSFIADTKNTAKITIQSGATANNLVFKPMIKLASDPSDEYVPYAMTNRELTEVVESNLSYTTQSHYSFDTAKTKIQRIGNIVIITGQIKSVDVESIPKGIAWVNVMTGIPKTSIIISMTCVASDPSKNPLQIYVHDTSLDVRGGSVDEWYYFQIMIFVN